MPRVVEKLRENQSGHWDDSWEAKRSTSDLLKRSQIWDTVWRFNIHSPGLSLDRKSAARFSIPGNVNCPQRKEACPRCATLTLPDGLCGTQPPYCPFWLWYDTPRERGKNTSKPGRQPWVPGSLYAKRGTLPSTLCSPVCPRRPRPSLSCVRRDHMATVDRTHSHPALEKGGVSP